MNTVLTKVTEFATNNRKTLVTAGAALVGAGIGIAVAKFATTSVVDLTVELPEPTMPQDLATPEG